MEIRNTRQLSAKDMILQRYLDNAESYAGSIYENSTNSDFHDRPATPVAFIQGPNTPLQPLEMQQASITVQTLDPVSTPDSIPPRSTSQHRRKNSEPKRNSYIYGTIGAAQAALTSSWTTAPVRQNNSKNDNQSFNDELIQVPKAIDFMKQLSFSEKLPRYISNIQFSPDMKLVVFTSDHTLLFFHPATGLLHQKILTM